MKKTTTKKEEVLVNFILDKSGSMSSVQESTISGFNEYVQTLKNDGNKYSFSLVFFDTDTKQTYTNEPIKNVGKLDKENYQPSGSTALYDAVCKTIDAVKDTVKKSQKVLTVIMTDGEENSSREYSQEQLKAKISELEKGNWSFVFLGANQNSWANAQKMGIQTMNTANFVQTDAGIHKTMRMMASNTRGFAMSASVNTANFFTASDQKDLDENNVANHKVSAQFSSMGNKSWEVRKKKLLGE